MNRYSFMRTWMGVGVLLVTMLAISPAQAVTDEQQAKLNHIDKYIERLSQEAKDNYASSLIEIRAHKADEMRRLEITNPELYVQAGFIGWTEYVKKVLDLRGVDLMNDAQFADLFHKLRDDRGDMTTTEKLDISPKLLAIAQDRFAKEENRALRGYGMAELQAEKNKNYVLNVQLPQLSEQLKNSVLNPPQPAPNGVVTGIVYSPDKPAAVIGGKVVSAGDSLGSVKVVRIDKETVEFQKGGQTWKQKIGETPSSSLWQ